MPLPFYRLVPDYDALFAEWARVGTWVSIGPKTVCPNCSSPLEHRVSPLVVERLPGRHTVGDFVFPSFLEDVLVTEQVMHRLIKAHPECFRFEKVEIKERGRKTQRAGHPPKRTKATERRVTFYEMKVVAKLPILMTRSAIQPKTVCLWCGTYIIEELFDTPVYVELPKGFEPSVFRLFQAPAFICVSERIRATLEGQFSNLLLKPTGLLISP
jgi:hypothetical protein